MKYNSTNESSDMTLIEIRFIQYSKIMLALIGIVLFGIYLMK
jgi:hypothetical protein